jgi:hypothetical protein
MAFLQASFNQAFSRMERGSQRDGRTVMAATTPFAVQLNQANLVSELRPHVLDLLHVAGWLYPCFMPSSRLKPAEQLGTRLLWHTCVGGVQEVLRVHPLNSMDAFLPLLEPRTRPQVPGEERQLQQTSTPAVTQEWPHAIACPCHTLAWLTSQHTWMMLGGTMFWQCRGLAMCLRVSMWTSSS